MICALVCSQPKIAQPLAVPVFHFDRKAFLNEIGEQHDLFNSPVEPLFGQLNGAKFRSKITEHPRFEIALE